MKLPPLVWEVSHRNHPHIEIHVDGGQCVAYMATGSAESLAIAKFIVEACNAACAKAMKRRSPEQRSDQS